MRKRLVAGALAAGLALTGGTVVGAQELETAGKDKDHKVIRLYSRAVEGVDTEAFLVGPPGSGGMGQGEPEFVDGVGFMFTETVWAANKEGQPYGDPVGRAIIECRVIGVNDPDPEGEGEEGEEATLVCEGYLQLPKGDIYVETSFDISELETGIHGGVSSGSERYEGAGGGFSLTETPIEGDDENTAAVWELRLEKDDHDRH